jgi:PAS domain S-box-containing protein
VIEAAENRTVYNVEYRIRRREGAVVWIAATGRAVYSRDGAVLGMLGIVQDVTERKRIEMALAEGSERLRIAAEAAALGIFDWNIQDDEAVWENDRTFEIFGRSRDQGPVHRAEFEGAYLDGESRAVFERAMQKATESGHFNAVCRLQRPDGTQPWIEIAGRLDVAQDATPMRLVGVVADITERKLAQERQGLLIRELHHRVKNTLATVQALVGSTARSTTTVDEFYHAFSDRIVSLAKTHSLLTEDYWQMASLREILENELGPYDEDGGDRIRLSGPPLELSADLAVPTGMAIHELTTNAVKHGALSVPDGRVEVAWEVNALESGRKLHLEWVERDGPPVAEPTRRGFGSTLLQRVLTAQVQATIDIDYQPTGLRFTMDAPLVEHRHVPQY